MQVSTVAGQEEQACSSSGARLSSWLHLYVQDAGGGASYWSTGRRPQQYQMRRNLARTERGKSCTQADIRGRGEKSHSVERPRSEAR
jgi:hypothetical protein